MSAFLHANWMHLIFNMLVLYMLGPSLAAHLGSGLFLLLYFASLLGGNLLALYLHRQHGSYASVGASGAINGLLFAAIALFPGLKLGLFLIPISLPAWLFGLLFIGISIYAIKANRNDSIGHEAHLGGALTGILMALMINPGALVANYVTILIVLVPILAFIYIIAYKPHLLMVRTGYSSKPRLTVDQRFNLQKQDEQKQIDSILEKIHTRGMNSLTTQEKQLLKQYADKQ